MISKNISSFLLFLRRFFEEHQEFFYRFSYLNRRRISRRHGSLRRCWNKGWYDRVSSSGERVSAANTNANF